MYMHTVCNYWHLYLQAKCIQYDIKISETVNYSFIFTLIRNFSGFITLMMSIQQYIMKIYNIAVRLYIII